MGDTFIDQEYAVVGIDTVKEHPSNPKKGDEDAIEASIEKNGWYGACVVQKSTGHILAGNHRHRVAKKRGEREIAVIFRDVDDETALRILLADNAIADLGSYDEELLDALLAELGDITGTGFDATLGAVERAGTRRVEFDAKDGTSTGGGDDDEQDDDADPGPDRYTPQYAILIECDSEEDQRVKYEMVARSKPDWGLRVVAV